MVHLDGSQGTAFRSSESDNPGMSLSKAWLTNIQCLTRFGFVAKTKIDDMRWSLCTNEFLCAR